MINQNDFPFGTCSTAAATAAKEVTISSGKFVLKEGCTVFVKFTNANSAAVGSITLNVNGTGAKNIKYINQSNIPDKGYIRANQTIMFTYDGTYWIYMSNVQYNTDTVNRLQQNGTIKAKTAITGGNIIVENDDTGYYHLKSNLPFDIRHPILYAGSNISAGSTGANNFISIAFTVTTTQNITLTAYTPLYIEGTLSGTTFTPVSATPLKQSSFTVGKHYILLGYVYNSTTAAYLLPEHPIFIATSTTELKSFTSVANSVSNKLKIFIEDTDSSTTCIPYDGSTEESVTIPSAGPLTFGTVSIYDQTFAGVKKFKDTMIVNKSIYNRYFNGNGNTGYHKIFKIVISETYLDRAVTFVFTRRSDPYPTKVSILFNSANSKDPTLKLLQVKGYTNKVYIKKTATSTWDVYIEKSQAWDNMVVYDLRNPTDAYIGKGIDITWYGSTEAVSSAVSGWTQATYYYDNSQIVYGVATIPATGYSHTYTIAFGRTFSTAPTVIISPVARKISGLDGVDGPYVDTVTTTNFTVKTFGTYLLDERVNQIHWFAIGN